MGQLPGSTGGCHVASLPSAADGKEPVAVCGRRQRACIAYVFSYTQPFSQQIDDTYIFFTWQVHSKHMRYPTHIISSYMHSSINHTQQVRHTCIQPYILQQCHPTIHAQFIDTKETQFIQTSTPSIKAQREKKHSIHASFRELNQICKMINKKLEEKKEEDQKNTRRRRTLEEE